MNIKRTWLVASATLALAGFTGAGVAMASDDVELKDPQQAPAVQLTNDPGTVPAADSARSANSASDSPGDPGYVPPAPAAADSANSPTPAPAPPAPAPAPADSANSPAAPPAPAPADSANSPAQTPAADSANSPDDDNDDD